MHHRLLLLLLTVLPGLCLAAPASAQAPSAHGPAAKGVAAEAPPEPPRVLDPEEIAGAAETARATLRTVTGLAAPTPDAERIEAELPGLANQLRARADTATNRLEDYVSLDSLGDMQTQWQAPAGRLASERKLLTQRAQALGAAIQQLDALRDLWTRSREAARKGGAPQAVLGRIDDVLREIAAAERTVRDRSSAVLTLQSRVAQLEQITSDVLERIEQARSQERGRLLVRDNPPLWRALSERAPRGTFGGRLYASWTEQRDSFADFARDHPGVFGAQGAFFVATLLLALALRRRAARWAVEDESFAPAARLLGRPFSAALVVALVTGVWFAGTPLPSVVSDVMVTVLVVPVLRLLPGRLFAGMRPALYALVSLYLFDRLRDLLDALPLVERGLLLVESLGGALFLAWLIQPSRLPALATAGLWLRALGLSCRLGLALFGISLLANVIGNLNLARLLTEATLESFLAATILYAAARVLDGLVVVGLRTRAVRALRMVRNHTPLLRRRGVSAVHALLSLYWVWVVLGRFALRDAAGIAAHDLATAQIEVGEVTVSFGDVLLFGLIVWATFLFSRLLRFVLDEDVMPRLSLPRGVPYAISYVLHYGILLLGFLLAAAAAGMEISRFALLAGALGVGIGFGLQNVVNNFISGLILLFERPVQLGDTIQVGELMGEVRRIGIRSSTVRTWQGAEVIVPNGNLISEQVVNWTLSDKERRLEISVGVAYGTDPTRVLELLREVGGKHPGIQANPAPTALFLGFGDSSLNFELRVWTADSANWMQIKSDITVAINAALRDAGIEIPFPQRDLHLKSVAPALRGEPR